MTPKSYFGKTFQDLKTEIFDDLGASYWIRDAIDDLDMRDVVDVLHELDVLKELFWRKYKESGEIR
jgi:hypothetical protein